ncbi:histidine utilization repressor [Mangrovicoccus algicola]|uniref:Histidine utilization repressor n=1 Tax=Mangrovicoccus algicola TaxID=2771008 RepID=A0A8J6YW48_9RHOB|nr:histidine utilization repressor [Mangrovicoccus algicola]MBE3638965.1 histidine utilization repressor [Mangrovicoccus algicola]
MDQAPGPAKSLHDTILGEIEARILSGEWPPGHQVPSELELSESYGCSRMTVNKVMTQLAQAGLIRRRRRVGSVVLPQKDHVSILEIHDVRDDVEAAGGRYSHRILARDTQGLGAEEAARYGLAEGAAALRVLCLHRSDDRPFALEDRLIFLDSVPEAAGEPFAAAAPGLWLVDHVPWSAAENQIAAVAAGAEEAARLELAEGAPCLAISRRTWKQGAPVTAVRFLYPGGLHRLTARFTPRAGG